MSKLGDIMYYFKETLYLKYPENTLVLFLVIITAVADVSNCGRPALPIICRICVSL